MYLTKTKKPNMLRFVAMLTCALMLLMAGTALASGLEGRGGTTSANVSFSDGSLSFGEETGGSGMHLNFGSHTIPYEAVSYPAVNQVGDADDEHILPVVDSRFASGSWQVTVSLTPFTYTPEEGDPSAFDGAIRFVSPIVANVNTSAGTAGLTVDNDFSVLSGMDATTVMTADDTLPRGIFTATWTNEKVTLNISDDEVSNVGPVAYGATLTWSLVTGP